MKSKEEKEDPRALNGRKVAKNRDFPMICGLGGSQKKLAKAAGAEPCGQRRNEKIACHCGAKRTLKSKCTKRQLRTTFGSSNVEYSTLLWHKAHFQVKMLTA